MTPPRVDLDASFRRHQELMRLYSSTRGRSDSVASNVSSITLSNDREVSELDLTVLRDKFQFIRDDEADAEQGETDWQIRMSVRYYRQLFREYALADLSRYQESKIGLRWRTEMEVLSGKGQFSCGNKRCDARDGLHSYELLFAYVEHGERKRCLVKVRVCGECAEKLFFKKLAELRRKKEKMEKRERKRRVEGAPGKQKAKRRRRSTSRSDEDEDEDGGEQKVKQDSGENAVSGGGIHELCAKINDEEKAAYPAEASQVSNSKPEQSARCREGFAELLP